jgi:uncharacterized protein YjbI with pentapeptide repeats
MADENDLRDLRAGDLDMVRRDLRGADLSNMDLQNRDFSGAHLEGANFSNSNLQGCIFSGSKLMKANFEKSNLRNTKFIQTVIYGVNLKFADLENSVLDRSHFTISDLSMSKIEGTSFIHSHINDGTTFEGCTINKDTKFDGANILRPIARQPAFRYYRVERGVLVIKSDAEIEQDSFEESSARREPDERNAARDAAVERIDSLLVKLKDLAPPERPPAAHGGIGHNNPPEETPIERPEYDALQKSLIETKEALLSEKPDPAPIEESRRKFVDVAVKIGIWAAQKANIFADEFSKTLGKTAATGVTIWAGWTAVKADLHHLTEALAVFVKLLG